VAWCGQQPEKAEDGDRPTRESIQQIMNPAVIASPAPDAERSAISVTVRLAGASDLIRIGALQRFSIMALSSGHYDERQIDSILRYMPLTDGYLIADRTYYVAEIAGRIVGCGGWSIRTPGYHEFVPEPQSPGSATPRVRAVYVHPHFVQRAVGPKLLQVIEQAMAARGHDKANLDEILPRVSLYLKCGYQLVGHTHVSFPTGVRLPLVSMRKRLSIAERSRACLRG
jgi:GNAT superfamily N-acetyltransferase